VGRFHVRAVDTTSISSGVPESSTARALFAERVLTFNFSAACSMVKVQICPFSGRPGLSVAIFPVTMAHWLSLRCRRVKFKLIT
jgi:hypothetical protein